MDKGPAVNWGIGIAAGAAVGAGAWLLLQRGKRKKSVSKTAGEAMDKIEDIAEQARGKAGGIVRTLREKGTPLIQTIGELVEKNAEVVSALANVNADQVRQTGQEIRKAAATLDKNLEALSNI